MKVREAILSDMALVSRPGHQGTEAPSEMESIGEAGCERQSQTQEQEIKPNGESRGQ